MFIITTDGMENASRKYTSDEVKKLISQKKELGWEFLFLGANIDAVETAKHFGIEEDRAVTYKSDKKGTRMNFAAMGKALHCLRCESEALTADWKADIENRDD